MGGVQEELDYSGRYGPDRFNAYGNDRKGHAAAQRARTSVMLLSKSSIRFPISSMRPMIDDDI